MDYRIILYIIFGVLPSLIWLFYYLRKDLHPEPKRMILSTFIWGALITLPVLLVQMGLKEIINSISLGLGLPDVNVLLLYSTADLTPLALVIVLAYWFIVIAASEEIFKYLIVKAKITNSPNLDEPVDIMLYMVIAALGFSALENILYLFPSIGGLTFNDLVNQTLSLSLIRFIGATFLHTLCSAVIGYSMAISFCKANKQYLYIILGILGATALHGVYDFSIITLDGYANVIVPVATIFILAILVFAGFERLKKMKSVCSLK